MAAKQEWKPGDLVVLKSGGPVMTVNTVFDDGDVRCAWFNGKKHETADVNAATLRRAEEDEL
jgi:uncharacterized protein YodC (DUF2158 family)